jgi:TRAP-type C4-dicarboxylate transport system substrate-binding protein
MCAPGCWAITGFVPDGDIVQLPAMYDQPLEMIHPVTDGKPGQLVAAHAEQKLGCHVLGRWLDNGFSNWFTVKAPLHTLDDLKGLKLRNSGGSGQSWRTKFFGGIPTVTTWPAVPLALSQGMFDGLISANDSVVSAKLWDTGLRYSLQDHNFFGTYLPMLSHAFWEKLPDDLRHLLSALWEDNIAAYREHMAAGQARAYETLKNLGMTMVELTPDQGAAVRAKMMPEQDAVAKEMRISPDIVEAVMQEIGKG